jgi:thiol-disulfide isomerase/thioredoxin
MCRCKKTIAYSLLAAVMLTSFSAAELKKGDKLPDLSSYKLEGPVPKLQGQVVLVDFWASWCDPCKASFPEMEKLNRAYASRGLTILAVNVDEKRANMDRFLKANKISFATVRDAEQKLVAAADVQTMPTSFLIDRSGKVRFIHNGFRGEQTVKEYRQQIEQLLSEKE